MSEEIRNHTRRKVTSVGNSWIVCKSRSHPGHIYYFNSLTGETAWNLSDAEIEKAKHRTKRLEHQLGAKSTKCPEPKEKPPSTAFNNSEPLQSLSSEQFVINTNSEQQSSDLTYNKINSTFCTSLMQGSQFNNPASIEPVCNFNSYNNPLGTYHLNSTSTVYNPKIWAVPHTQQVFIAPGVATVVNHSPGPLNVPYTQNVSQPVTGHVFNSFDNPAQSATSGTQVFYPRHFNHDQGPKRTMNKKNGFTKSDLRQKITFKKRFNMKSNIPGGSGFFKTNPRKADIATNSNKVEGIHSNDLSTGTESRCLETQLPSKIDLGPLKSLAPSDSNSDAWFIVVDLEVLLHEFKFLTTLTDSDEKCYLMVPKMVMEELKSYVATTENIQAKRILRFLSQQIEIGYAYMAEEPSKVEGDSMAEVIHKTCKELLGINYHLILLTNDNELLTKDATNINMFSVDEIKNLLMEIPNKQLVSPGPKKPYISNELLNKIKITVLNDTQQNIDTTTPVRDIQSDDHIDNVPITPPKQNNTPDETEKLLILKQTVDAGIQTDLEDINASISITNVVEKQRQNADSNFPSQYRNEAITRPVSLVSNILDKKREIKLKRSTSHQPFVNSIESGKKQFKWRRKTITSLQVNEEIPSHNEQIMKRKNVESLQTNTLNNEISKLSVKKSHNNIITGCTVNKILDDSIESKESSIYTEPRNSTAKENVTIEETSTSGIISNTESNVDAESTYSNSTNQQPVYRGQSNKAMYEVDSITMEQYLKTKCDEWISRFIQIMEEVLTQVLHQDPPFTHNAMPPPWTLHEAAQCVAMKFCGHQGIMTAANKLSNILFQVSDAKGQIAMNMTPYQYMHMYSYGVHLLAEIMEVTNSCEDIQIAVESLNKLLRDIRNPNMDSSTNDVFSENIHNNMSNNDVSADSDMPNNNNDTSLHEEEMLSDCSHAKEVPKDKKSMSSEEKLQKPVKFIRNIDIPISFIENLGRQKISPVQSREQQRLTHSQMREGKNPRNANETTAKRTHSVVPTNELNIIRKFTKFSKLEEKLSGEEKHLAQSKIREGNNLQNANKTNEKGTDSDVPTYKQNIVRKFTKFSKLEEKLSGEEKHLAQSKIREGNNLQNANKTNEKGTDSDVPTYKQNIVRKFTKFPKLEEKLKSNYNLKVYADHNFDLDYNESYDEYITEDYCSDDENYNEQSLDAIDNQMDVAANTNEAYEPEGADTNGAYESINPEDDSLLDDEDSKKFKYMMCMLLREIRNALNQVRVLCDQCYKELKNPEESTELKYELRKRAERAHLHTIRLCRSLESMLDNETNNPNQSMSDFLEQADINIRHVDAGLLFEYRTTVAKCKDHADEFLNSIQNIISDIKR